MSRKIYKYEWEFNGNKFKVGQSLNESHTSIKDDDYNTLVWFENKVYKAIIKPESKGKLDRVGLWDIYNTSKKPYWTTVDKVYQIIKL